MYFEPRKVKESVCRYLDEESNFAKQKYLYVIAREDCKKIFVLWATK